MTRKWNASSLRFGIAIVTSGSSVIAVTTIGMATSRTTAIFPISPSSTSFAASSGGTVASPRTEPARTASRSRNLPKEPASGASSATTGATTTVDTGAGALAPEASSKIVMPMRIAVASTD